MTNEEIVKRNEALSEEMMKLVNFMTNDTELALTLNEFISKDHRTLQQNFWRTIQILAREYAKTNKDRTDLRNEASVSFAQAITDLEVYLPSV